MISSILSIISLSQKDNFTFTIRWSDGQITDYELSQLQLHCPCANCVDEQTGNRRSGLTVSADVRAHKIASVGRYALRVYFTSGCSAGIFSFEMLKGMQ